MKISVFGAGYVGLTTAAGLAEIGHCVCCADNDDVKLNLLQSGQMPFFEPHLKDLVPSRFVRRSTAGVARDPVVALQE